jgi:hypothetical protein
MKPRWMSRVDPFRSGNLLRRYLSIPAGAEGLSQVQEKRRQNSIERCEKGDRRCKRIDKKETGGGGGEGGRESWIVAELKKK